MNISEIAVVDELQRELDAIEKTVPMVDNYARIDPVIYEHDQAGVRFRFVAYHFESQAWFNPEHIEWSLQHIQEKAMLRDDDVVFDLGCNSGYHTVWFGLSASAGQVHAFDPYPWNAAATKAQARLNGLGNVHVHPVGLGGSNRTIRTDATSSKTFNADSPRPGYYIDINVRRPDEYLHFRPTFLKIDIEGAEHELVRSGLLECPSVREGYVEMHPQFIEAGGEDAHGFLDHLAASGFSTGPDDDHPYDPMQPVIATGYYFSRPPA